MGWDASRPVPWRRLTKEWVIYAAIMAVVLAVIYRDAERVLPILGGLLVSGPLYLALGYVLAKFGYARKTLADLRTPRASAPASSSADAPPARNRPAPTRRTSTGPNRSRSKKR
jgi:hypothetical protein